MAAKQAPNTGLNYGWALGDSGWNAQMDENLLAADMLIQLEVISRSVSAPPVAPAAGDRYIVPPGATGAWAGLDGKVVRYNQAVWEVYTQKTGWRCVVQDEGTAGVLIRYNGTAWVGLPTTLPYLNKDNATVDPTATDDLSLGYDVGSRWINTTGTGEIWRCIDGTIGAARWLKTTLTLDELGSAATQPSSAFDPAGAAAAAQAYNNTLTGLSATTLQDAIDEIAFKPAAQPSLNLDFEHNEHALLGSYGLVKSDLSAAIANSVISFARSTTAYRTNALGILESVAANTPRIDYDPVTGENLGVLIEEQRTNLSTSSETLAVGVGVTVTADSTAAPDGNPTADLVIEDSSTGEHFVADASFTPTVGVTYVWSTFVKNYSGDRLLLMRIAAGNVGAISFDPAAGQIINLSNGVISNVISEYFPAFGFYRVSVIWTATSATGTVCRTQLTTSTTQTGKYAGNGASGLYIWGRQLEAGSFPSSYIQTTTAHVTRTADALTRNTGIEYNTREWSVLVDSSRVGWGQFPYAFYFGDGTNSNRILLYRGASPASSTTQFIFEVTVGGVATQIGIPASSKKVAVSLTETLMSVSADGSPVLSSPITSIPPSTIFSLGSANGGSFANGQIKFFSLYPRALSNTELQELTK